MSKPLFVEGKYCRNVQSEHTWEQSDKYLWSWTCMVGPTELKTTEWKTEQREDK